MNKYSNGSCIVLKRLYNGRHYTVSIVINCKKPTRYTK